MKKIGLLALVLVMALGALGVGYAAWTDTIVIQGTVNTGSVDINAWYFSGTFVYKDLRTDELVTIYFIWDEEDNIMWQSQDHSADFELVAWARAYPGGSDDTVVVRYWGLFPSIDFVADVYFHYGGTVPAKVNLIDWKVTEGAEWIEPLIAEGHIYGLARRATVNADAREFIYDDGAVVLPGTQLHWCDWVWFGLTIHLPQDNDLMNKYGSFTATIEVVQWNKYPHD